MEASGFDVADNYIVQQAQAGDLDGPVYSEVHSAHWYLIPTFVPGGADSPGGTS